MRFPFESLKHIKQLLGATSLFSCMSRFKNVLSSSLRMCCHSLMLAWALSSSRNEMRELIKYLTSLQPPQHRHEDKSDTDSAQHALCMQMNWSRFPPSPRTEFVYNSEQKPLFLAALAQKLSKSEKKTNPYGINQHFKSDEKRRINFSSAFLFRLKIFPFLTPLGRSVTEKYLHTACASFHFDIDLSKTKKKSPLDVFEFPYSHSPFLGVSRKEGNRISLISSFSTLESSSLSMSRSGGAKKIKHWKRIFHGKLKYLNYELFLHIYHRSKWNEMCFMLWFAFFLVAFWGIVDKLGDVVRQKKHFAWFRRS